MPKREGREKQRLSTEYPFKRMAWTIDDTGPMPEQPSLGKGNKKTAEAVFFGCMDPAAT